jgi:nicotinate-nucleotide pyrophosphorylase (carboxylating)
MYSMDPAQLGEFVAGVLAEDIGSGDVTTEATIPADMRSGASILVREPAVVAGLEIARLCFDMVGNGDISWQPAIEDGKRAAAGDVLVDVKGLTRVLLVAERSALNLLGRLSGIATLTAQYVDAVAGTGARILDTRKTTPGLRALEKYAVAVGGGTNHRFGLHDGILIKDNHLAAAGSITEAIRLARAKAGELKVEVEVEDLDGLDEAISAGADIVLLDNMDPGQTRAAVERAGGRVLLESSGGIHLDNVRSYAETGVDLISVGALTHSARAVDLTMEMSI